jgi:S-adenosyl-methyltransferase MraW
VHIPVLLNETIAALNPKPNVNFIDCTFGRGGHSLAILERTAPRGRILAIERDAESLNALPQELKEHPRIVFVGASYADLGEIVREKEFENVGGVLFDLGMSSWHLEESGKGFAFSRDEPLDMRYDRKSPLTAADVLNRFSAAELRDIFQNYGQERTAKKIAAAVERERKKKKSPLPGSWPKSLKGKRAPAGGAPPAPEFFRR